MTDHHTKVTAAAAVLGPLALLGSTLAYVGQGDTLNDGKLGGAIQVWAFVGIGIAILGVIRLIEDEAPRAAAVLTVIGMLGAAGGIGFGIDSMQVEVFNTEPLQEVDGSLAPFALNIPGLMFPFSLIGLGVLLARTRAVPAVLGYGLAVTGVLFPASRFPDVVPLAVVSDVALVLALGGIGLRLLGGAPARMTSVTSS